jgi:hypothetical protein
MSLNVDKLYSMIRFERPSTIRVWHTECEDPEDIAVEPEGTKWGKWKSAAETALSFDWFRIALLDKEGKILVQRKRAEGVQDQLSAVQLKNESELTQVVKLMLLGQQQTAQMFQECMEPLVNGLRDLTHTLSKNLNTAAEWKAEDLDLLREAAVTLKDPEHENPSKWQQLIATGLGAAAPALIKQYPGIGMILHSMFGGESGGNGKTENPLVAMFEGIDMDRVMKAAARFSQDEPEPDPEPEPVLDEESE